MEIATDIPEAHAFTPGLPKLKGYVRFCKQCATTKPVAAFTPYRAGGMRRKVCDACWELNCTPDVDVSMRPLPERSLGEKECNECHITKPLTDFHQQITGAMGRQAKCIECKKLAYKVRQKAEYPPGTIKRCIECKHEKLIEDFPMGGNTYGRASKCKECTALYAKWYQETHVAEVRIKSKRQNRRYKMDPEHREAMRVKAASLKFEDHRRYMFKGIKERSKKRGVPMTVELHDIPDMPTHCEVHGIPLFYGKGRKGPNSPSLDKIDNTKGYVPGNLRIISARANEVKGDASIAELEAVVAYMKRHLAPA